MTPEEWANEAASKFMTPGTHQMSDVRQAIASVISRAIAEALDAGMPGSPLTVDQLVEIDARFEAITPPPWHIGSAAEGLHSMFCDGNCHNIWAGEHTNVTGPCGGLSGADAEFIAFAPNDNRAMRAHIDHQNALIRDLAQDNVGHAYRAGYADGVKTAAELTHLLKNLYAICNHEWGACPECGNRGKHHDARCRLALALGLPRQNA